MDVPLFTGAGEELSQCVVGLLPERPYGRSANPGGADRPRSDVLTWWRRAEPVRVSGNCLVPGPVPLLRSVIVSDQESPVASPSREVRAVFDDESITVYQAYPAQIARAALTAGTFVAPFKRERMTWIKPSFTWMMYRCGWATKPGQERVLAIRITRDGWHEALTGACLSHFDRAVYDDAAAWERRKNATAVRVQWDPERTASGAALAHRSLQVGLSGYVVDRYLDEWIVELRDITEDVHELHRPVRDGEDVSGLLPPERPYPLPGDVAVTIGASAAGGSGVGSEVREPACAAPLGGR